MAARMGLFGKIAVEPLYCAALTLGHLCVMDTLYIESETHLHSGYQLTHYSKQNICLCLESVQNRG